LIFREHQLSAINECIKYGSGLFVMATGGGKSLCCAALSRVYSAVGNVVVIVPSIHLVIQTRKVFRGVGIDCGIWYGGEKERRQVTMATWQSLDHFDELFDGTNTVIVDEVQGAKAKVLGEILAGPAKNVPFRFGCTGTLPKEDLALNQIFGVVGVPRTITTSRDLQNIGLLAEAEVHQIMLDDRANPSYTEAVGGRAKNATEERKFGHEDWNSELDWFAREEPRMEWIAAFLQEIAQDGNTFVVIERKFFIEKLRVLIPQAYVMTGDDNAKTVREPMLKEFAAGQNNILICTPGVGAVGLDAPSIRNVVPIELGKATIKIMQTMGRGLRPIPGKLLMLYDIYGNAKLSKRHAAERRKAFETYGQIVHHTEASYL
jgi:superfamily II DNA or RNA helicase